MLYLKAPQQPLETSPPDPWVAKRNSFQLQLRGLPNLSGAPPPSCKKTFN